MKRENRTRCSATIALLLGTLFSTAKANNSTFDPLVPPSKAEWQHFHKMSDADLTKFWTFQGQRGHQKLSAWSWQWRIGWIQRCGGRGLQEICQTILLDGLNDNAMVVRAESATKIGQRYAGKPSPSLIKALQNAYNDPRNSRHGNPLFVYERILEALRNFADPEAAKVAQKLASRHPTTKAYWASIQKNYR